MIAEVANALGDPEGPGFLAIEAGTGTGKTIAYTIAALPVAQARSKKLIIATATVALQEQLVARLMPYSLNSPTIIATAKLVRSYRLAPLNFFA